MQEMMASDIQYIEDLKRQQLFKPSIVFNYFGDLWNHKFQTLLFTLLATLLISGGFITRDYLTRSIVKYELKNTQLSRIAVHRAFKDYCEIVRNLRAKMKLETEYFDNTKLQHPLYKIHKRVIKQRTDIDPDEFYLTLLKLTE